MEAMMSVAVDARPAVSTSQLQRTALITACVGNFALQMAIGPITAIEPTLTQTFGVDISIAGWLMTIFFLMVTSFVLIAGRLGDLYGHSRIFSVGITLFTLSSLAAGFSQGIYQLIAARGFQGLGGAMMLASGFALIGNNFSGAQIGKAVGLVTTSTGLGGLFGVFLSTFILPSLGWRWIFFAMVPLGLLGIWSANELRKVDHERYPSRIDYAGAVFIFLTLATLSLSFNHLHQGGESFTEGWYYHLPMHALTLIFFSALVFVEMKSPAPLINFRVFKNATFSSAVAANGICHSTMMGTNFLMPFLVERGLLLDSHHTGVLLMSMTVMMVGSGLFGGFLYDRFKSPLIAPLAIGAVAAGLVSLGLLANRLSYEQFIAYGVLFGLAMGIFFTVNNVIIIRSLPSSMRGLASGLEQSSRQLGHTLGITATSAAMATAVPRELIQTLPASAYIDGFQRAVILVGAIAIVGALLSALKGNRVAVLNTTIPARAPQPAPLGAD